MTDGDNALEIITHNYWDNKGTVMEEKVVEPLRLIVSSAYVIGTCSGSDLWNIT